jgi:hypothetical protein
MNNWEGRMKSETLHHGFIAQALLVILLAIVTAFLLPQTSFADDLYVSKNGTDSGDCLVNACQTVAYAITKAGSGDRINIGPGIFYGNLELAKNLSFMALAWMPQSWMETAPARSYQIIHLPLRFRT